jgi:hypothetical protein
VIFEEQEVLLRRIENGKSKRFNPAAATKRRNAEVGKDADHQVRGDSLPADPSADAPGSSAGPTPIKTRLEASYSRCPSGSGQAVALDIQRSNCVGSITV